MSDKQHKLEQLNLKIEGLEDTEMLFDTDKVKSMIYDGQLDKLFDEWKELHGKTDSDLLMSRQAVICALVTWFRDNLFRFLKEGVLTSGEITLSMDSNSGYHKMSETRTVDSIVERFAKKLKEEESKESK